MAYRTGLAIVDVVLDDIRPSRVMTRAAFINAVKTCTALGGSTNARVHLRAIANQLGVELDITDWQTHGEHIPMLVNCQPAGEFLGEDFYRAGGIPAVLGELLQAGELDATA